MDKEKPWIKYWKKSENDELYNTEPFDKWHTWVDLLILADDSGTVKTSLKALQIRWKWGSRKKVWKHLRTLSETGKVTLTETPNGTVIFIKKYWGYQNNFKDKKQPKGNTSGNNNGNTFGNTEDTNPKEGGSSLPPSGGSEAQEEIEKPFDPSVGDWDDE